MAHGPKGSLEAPLASQNGPHTAGAIGCLWFLLLAACCRCTTCSMLVQEVGGSLRETFAHHFRRDPVRATQLGPQLDARFPVAAGASVSTGVPTGA